MEENKTKSIGFRVTPEEKRELKKQMKSLGFTKITTFMKHVWRRFGEL